MPWAAIARTLVTKIEGASAYSMFIVPVRGNFYLRKMAEIVMLLRLAVLMLFWLTVRGGTRGSVRWWGSSGVVWRRSSLGLNLFGTLSSNKLFKSMSTH